MGLKIILEIEREIQRETNLIYNYVYYISKQIVAYGFRFKVLVCKMKIGKR